MTGELTGAADILSAFEDAASGVDPIVALSRGFALAVRHQGHGVLSPDVRRAITDKMWWVERAARDQLPATFEPARLHKGVEDSRAGLITTLNATGDATGAASSAIARSAAL